MEFEFGPAKSASNKDKHGIDFIEAQYIMIARLDGKICSAIFTYRGDRIRIISVRRARDEERQHYENDEC
jgi:uncharacterized DUF497 family protein